MIIVAIIALAAVVVLALYAVLASLPAMPQGIFTVVNYCAQYLASGAGFFYTFVDRSVAKPALEQPNRLQARHTPSGKIGRAHV